MTSRAASFAIVLLVCFLPQAADASSEYATFKRFYVPDVSVPWWGWALAGLAAVGIAAAVYFSAGTATPAAVAVGTAIGNMMGLSGAAATSAGLALLGGGSIAAGGLGMVGGAALVTGALTFGTEMVVGYSVEYALRAYDLRRFKEQSAHMLTLPPPRNLKGSEAYEATARLLEGYDPNLPTSAESNQQLIYKAAADAGIVDLASLDDGARCEMESFLALCKFQLDDFSGAKAHALTAIEFGRRLDRRRTLPAFIYAVSSLYDENLDGSLIVRDYFRYSVLAEPDNQLIELMVGIFAERALFRFGDGSVTPDDLSTLVEVADAQSLNRKVRAASTQIVASQFLVRMKEYQQDILVITSDNSDELLSSDRAPVVLKERLNSFERLLSVMEDRLSQSFSALDREFAKTDGSLRESDLKTLTAGYRGELPDLTRKIEEFVERQELFRREGGGDDAGIPLWLMIAVMLFILAFLAALIFRRSPHAQKV